MLEWRGEPVGLLPGKAVYLPRHATLLIADLHLGKASSFRQLGVPVPSGTTQESLGRLSALLATTGATRLVCLGDFLHSARARAPHTLAPLSQWRDQHAALAVTLVRGNHDAHAGDPPASLGIEAVDGPLRLGAWALSHHPVAHPGCYTWAGHLHPCVSVGGRARERLRLPCFHLGEEVGVLPAFGAFTGMHPVRRVPGDRLYAIAQDGVHELA